MTSLRHKDPTLSAMKKAGVPLNRDRYIEWATLGEYTSDNLDPELEEMLPEQFRRAALDELLTDKIQ
jgi:hypothetical protein